MLGALFILICEKLWAFATETPAGCGGTGEILLALLGRSRGQGQSPFPRDKLHKETG